MPQSIYIVGDVHGQLKKLLHLLQAAALLGHDLSWKGGNTTLWFIGNLVDRGPDGIGVVDLIMRLQVEAAEAGGEVSSLLGNHELLLLAAYRFGRRSTGLGSNFLSRWKQNGGSRKDLARLSLQHLDWLANLPAMACVDNRLLLHADAPFYLRYGRSIEEVNTAIRAVLRKSDALAWEELLDDFSRRGLIAADRVHDNGDQLRREVGVKLQDRGWVL